MVLTVTVVICWMATTAAAHLQPVYWLSAGHVNIANSRVCLVSCSWPIRYQFFFSIHELNVDIANQMAQHIDIIEFQLFGHVDSGATWRICHICDGATVNVMLCLARSIDHYSVRPNII